MFDTKQYIWLALCQSSSLTPFDITQLMLFRSSICLWCVQLRNLAILTSLEELPLRYAKYNSVNVSLFKDYLIVKREIYIYIKSALISQRERIIKLRKFLQCNKKLIFLLIKKELFKIVCKKYQILDLFSKF